MGHSFASKIVILSMILTIGLVVPELRADDRWPVRRRSDFSKSIQRAYDLQKLVDTPVNRGPSDWPLVALKLLSASHLEMYLSSPTDLELELVKADAESPDATYFMGRIKINSSMSNLMKEPEIEAVVIGHEILHHIFAHDLVLLSVQLRPLPKLRERFNIEDELELQTRQRDFDEAEVDSALPQFLKNAGFNPWAIVSFYERLSEYQKGKSEFARVQLLNRAERIRENILNLEHSGH